MAAKEGISKLTVFTPVSLLASQNTPLSFRRFARMLRRDVGVFVLALVLLLVGNDRIILYSLDEARNAQCAREMLHRGDIVVPTFNGELRTQKPPFAYYTMMLSMWLLGESPFAARLPMALAGAILVLVVYRLGRRYHEELTGLLGAGLLLASVHFQLQMSMSVPDPYLLLWITLALAAFLRALSPGHKLSWAWYFLAYTYTALGVLTKGPIAAWIIGASVLLHLAWQREGWKVFLRRVWALYPIPGILWVAALVTPWVWAVQVKTQGAWLRDFIGYQNVQRFSEPLEGHGGFLGITLLFVLVGMVPATTWLPQTLRHHWSHYRTQPLVSVSLAAVVVIVGTFLVAATRLPNYTTPAYPFLALLIGGYFAAGLSGTVPISSWRWSFLGALVVALTIPIGGYFGLKSNPDVADFAPLALLALVPAAIVAIGIVRLTASPRQAILWLLGGYMLLASLGLGYLYPQIYRDNPVSESLPLIDTRAPVVAYKGFNPAFVFELPNLVPVFSDVGTLEGYLRTLPGATVISRGEHREELEAIGLKPVYLKQDLFEFSTTLVLRWQRSPHQPLEPAVADGRTQHITRP